LSDQENARGVYVCSVEDPIKGRETVEDDALLGRLAGGITPASVVEGDEMGIGVGGGEETVCI
jgi:hypothetical protein